MSEDKQLADKLCRDLAALRASVGDPSHMRMSKAVRGFANPVSANTLRNAEVGKWLPALATVIQFVTACQRVAEQDGIVITRARFELSAWQDRWYGIKNPSSGHSVSLGPRRLVLSVGQKWSGEPDDQRDSLMREVNSLVGRAARRARGDHAHLIRQSSGDGEFLALPPEDLAISALFFGNFIRELRSSLTARNHQSQNRRQLRVKLAAHFGALHQDEHGVTGTAIIATSRMVESLALREVFQKVPLAYLTV
ncbi:hypothetical protein AB0M34_30410 [Nocardia sp. NPDC050193]